MKKTSGLLLFFAWVLMVSMACGVELPGVKYGDKEPVSPGVWYQHARDTSVPWDINILEIDTRNRNVGLIPVYVQPRMTPSGIARRENAVACINGGYFNTSSFTTLSYFEKDNLVEHSGNGSSFFGISPGIKPKMVMTRLQKGGTPFVSPSFWNDITDGIGGGPKLVDNGILDVGKTEPYNLAGHINARHPRSAVGFNTTNNRLYFVVVDGRQKGWSAGMSCTELGKLMLDLGCHYALNYDGGGSSGMVVRGSVKNRPSDGTERKVPTAWVIVQGVTMDNLDPECHISGRWNRLTGEGVYFRNGLSINGGDTRAAVTWIPTLESSGQYKLYAWWGKDSTQSTHVPVIVWDTVSAQTVFVDQSVQGGTWNLVGTFNLKAGGQNTIKIQNVADKKSKVSADAVRLVYLGPVRDEVIIDNQDPKTSRQGEWLSGAYGAPVNKDYVSTVTGTGSSQFNWETILSKPGRYEVSAWWVNGTNRNTEAKYEIYHSQGTETVTVDQTQNGNKWNVLGRFEFDSITPAKVTLNNNGPEGKVVIADAVRFEYLGPVTHATK